MGWSKEKQREYMRRYYIPYRRERTKRLRAEWFRPL